MRGFSVLAIPALAFVPLAAAASDSGPDEPAMVAPVQETAAVDPERLAAAQVTVDSIFPAGTYARIMQKSMDAITGPMVDSLGTMPVQQIALMAGMPEEEVAKLGEATLAQVMEIYDPAYRERVEVTMRVMMDKMGGVMGRLEPDMRAGLARAYASRFSERQLAELNDFFATPTGALYAEQSMMIFLDPQVTESMQKLMPVLMEEMPGIQAAVMDATAKLPAPRSSCDLGENERVQLAALLGLPAMPPQDCEAQGD
ncbi:hypothetical protein MB02_09780 [Croceicoccus estronivorus]|uniref:DUF2059 domain-containing protein n=1 Tax=Croceicoccus estronivorus TaxID=1172626 RepID=UPI000829F57D|nr:DUF2059 domain-containing protein [Croceicoccus estronivorus]OCC24077.1 hypothetical protein MB02_09780 [Croceicoccus estronivorus]